MNVLILGSGGREHALTWKINQSPLVKTIFCAPGNAGTALLSHNVDLDILDFESVANFCQDKKIDLVIVGPEAPLVDGIVDYFESLDGSQPTIIGPNQSAARLEGSKDFAKKFMTQYGIPTALHRTFDGSQADQAMKFLDSCTLPIVLKADGLAAGKGVVICNQHEEAKEVLKTQFFGGHFGDAGKKVVIEEFLDGIEFSVFILTDGENYLELPAAKDYKRIGENDTGLNTGGMGAVSPVPFYSESLRHKVRTEIIEPTLFGLKDRNIRYTGFLFFGLMLVQDKAYVIEYNCRLGDPETEVILPRIESDLIPYLDQLTSSGIQSDQLKISDKVASTVMLVSGGYPEKYHKGHPILGLEALKSKTIFHAGTILKEGQVLTNGGRVMALTALDSTLDGALKESLEMAEQVDFKDKNYRKDIGFDLQP